MTTKDRNALTLPHSYDRAALARFELFLFAGIATVLITRAYLAATGYPQIGGGALHIAHVLWGRIADGRRHRRDRHHRRLSHA